jgi:hypothetical protein
MARIQKIHEVINGKLPSYNSAFINVRGIAFPLDIFLKGRLRFARKIGSSLSVWLPDNYTTLAEPLLVTQTKAILSLPLNWVVPGSKVLINEQLQLVVEDVVDNGYGLLFENSPVLNSAQGSSVSLFAHPLEVNGTFAPNTTFLIVKSDHKIYEGDEVNVGTVSYRIQVAILDQTLPDGRFQYQLIVDPGIPITLENERTDQVYLRAHPAYESPVLAVPTIANGFFGNVGPFLYDRVSGPFFTDMEAEEVDLIGLYDLNSDLIGGSYFRISKNYLVQSVSISADSFLFWDRVRGKMQWSGDKQAFISITDDQGVSHIHFKCIPTILVGYEVSGWRCVIEAESNTKMVVELEPNPPQEFTIPANTQTIINIDFPSSGSDIERIHVLFSTEAPNSQVYMRSWQPDSITVSFISHATIAKVVGNTVWASSGVMAKPYFLKLDYIKAQVDLLAKLDGGLLAL